MTTIRPADKGLLGIGCDADGSAVLLTWRELLEVDRDGRQRVAALSEPIGSGGTTVTHLTPGEVLVGIDSGEFGGGLTRIGRASGRVTLVERNATGALCGGPLNPACDPVTGIAPLPWKPGCVAATVGLAHMMRMHGRVVEVCWDRVEQIFSKTHGIQAWRGPGGPGEFVETLAFYGLGRAGDALLAVGANGLYRIGPGGRAETEPWPRFEEVGGVRVSFGVPGFVLVMPRVDARGPSGGGGPLLVPR